MELTNRSGFYDFSPQPPRAVYSSPLDWPDRFREAIAAICTRSVGATREIVERSLRRTVYMVAVFAALLAPAAARAQVVAPVPPTAPVASSQATVVRLACADRCGAAGTARPGSLLRVRGRALSRADEVVFLGVEGDADDMVAATSVRRRSSADVRVPFGAAPGPVAVVDRDGALSAPSAVPVALEPAPAPAAPSVELSVRAPRVFYDAAQPAALTYAVHAPAPADVAIDLVREADGVVIAHWDVPQVVPELAQRLSWDGTAAGRPQRDGRYAFRVSAAGLAPVLAGFEFARDQFPILGPFSFGSGTAAFGGGRGHQGEDTFAACGTPLVAAHGGVVKYAGFHARAGNYVVIDNEGAGTDYAYMHLRDAPLVATAARVRTGQPIGFVGDSGAASACHLHFEIWNAPGWYSGGRPIDPLPALRSWVSKG
jgi:murein DD-endopeptidase MepM/ murein hydrolase activator NlpD